MPGVSRMAPGTPFKRRKMIELVIGIIFIMIIALGLLLLCFAGVEKIEREEYLQRKEKEMADKRSGKNDRDDA